MVAAGGILLGRAKPARHGQRDYSRGVPEPSTSAATRFSSPGANSNVVRIPPPVHRHLIRQRTVSQHHRYRRVAHRRAESRTMTRARRQPRKLPVPESFDHRERKRSSVRSARRCVHTPHRIALDGSKSTGSTTRPRTDWRASSSPLTTMPRTGTGKRR